MKNQHDVETIKGWFKDHQATYFPGEYAEIIRWGRPGTIMYCVNYLWNGSFMVVTGDLGVTVFQVPAMSFQFLADADDDYAIGKIVATSHMANNRKGFSWDPRLMRKHIDEVLERKDKELIESGGPDHPDRITLEKLGRELISACSDTVEFSHKCHEMQDELHELFDSDWYEVINSNSGFEPSIHVLAHLEGLRMAVKALAAQGIEVK